MKAKEDQSPSRFRVRSDCWRDFPSYVFVPPKCICFFLFIVSLFSPKIVENPFWDVIELVGVHEAKVVLNVLITSAARDLTQAQRQVASTSATIERKVYFSL